MEDFIIYVNDIEEWQTIKDIDNLDLIFEKAKRHMVGGGTVILARKNKSGKAEHFESYSTLTDLESYRKNVYKYL